MKGIPETRRTNFDIQFLLLWLGRYFFCLTISSRGYHLHSIKISWQLSRDSRETKISKHCLIHTCVFGRIQALQFLLFFFWIIRVLEAFALLYFRKNMALRAFVLLFQGNSSFASFCFCKTNSSFANLCFLFLFAMHLFLCCLWFQFES